MTPTLRACALSFLVGLLLGLAPSGCRWLWAPAGRPGPDVPFARVSWCLLQLSLAEQGNEGVPQALVRAELDAVPEAARLDAALRRRVGAGLRDDRCPARVIEWAVKAGHARRNEEVYAMPCSRLLELLEAD